MYPLIRSTRNLFIAAAAWTPIILSVVILHKFLTGSELLDSILFLFPVMVIEFFIVLSTWYICRSIDINITKIPYLIFKHLIAVILMVSFWVAIASGYYYLMDFLSEQKIWPESFNPAFPLLASIGFFLYFLGCLFHYLVFSQEEMKKAENDALENELLLRETELKSLKSIIHPHFLFNSLSALSTLTQTAPDLAHKMSLQLADFLRASLEYSKKEMVTINDEIQHIKNYLDLEQIRLGDRLIVEFDINKKTLKLKVLPFLLLTLVENAIKHGFKDRLEKGLLNIKIDKTSENLIIQMTNPFENDGLIKKSKGYGISTLRKRLFMKYGEKAHIKLIRENQSFSAQLTIPL